MPIPDPIHLSALKTYSLKERKSKVKADDLARAWSRGDTFSGFLDTLPQILGAADLRRVVDSVSRAVKAGRPVVFAMGAHVIKVGLSPILIDLMERGIITAIAMNGAGIIHDFEMAATGGTSEDVAAALGDGTFGMAKETAEFLSEAILRAKKDSIGLGRAVGLSILDAKLPLAQKSLFAAAARLDIPATVHIAMGTDIIHIHPAFDPAAAGAASHRDFRTYAAVISELERGVYFNVGSAVLLPEVFLKAVTLVRNLGHQLQEFTAINLDFIRHYRPMTNVVGRPTASGGVGISLVGHHEILIPLIAAGIIEALPDPV